MLPAEAKDFGVEYSNLLTVFSPLDSSPKWIMKPQILYKFRPSTGNLAGRKG